MARVRVTVVNAEEQQVFHKNDETYQLDATIMIYSHK